MGINTPKLCFRLGVLLILRFLFGLLLVHVVYVVYVVWFFLRLLHLYLPATSSDEFDLFLHKNAQSFHSFSPFLHVACIYPLVKSTSIAASGRHLLGQPTIMSAANYWRIPLSAPKQKNWSGCTWR